MHLPAEQNITLYQLRVFLTVAHHLNYTRAAEELYLSQPSVSAQVHELEHLLGVPLFELVGKRLVLTQGGEVLQRHTAVVLSAVDEAVDAVTRLRSLTAGRLIVGASTTVGAYILPGVLGAYRGRYPEVEVQLDLMNSETICVQLREGRLEIGVVESAMPDISDDLHAEPYREDELVLIVPPWHPWAGLSEIPPSALTEATVLWREPGSGTRSAGENALRQLGVRPRRDMQIGGTDAIKQAVATNLGVAIVSLATISAEVTTGRLVALRLAEFPLRRTFHVVRRRTGHLSPAAEAFVHLLLGTQGEP